MGRPNAAYSSRLTSRHEWRLSCHHWGFGISRHCMCRSQRRPLRRVLRILLVRRPWRLRRASFHPSRPDKPPYGTRQRHFRRLLHRRLQHFGRRGQRRRYKRTPRLHRTLPSGWRESLLLQLRNSPGRHSCYVWFSQHPRHEQHLRQRRHLWSRDPVPVRPIEPPSSHKHHRPKGYVLGCHLLRHRDRIRRRRRRQSAHRNRPFHRRYCGGSQ